MWGRFEPCLGTFTLLFLNVFPVVPLKLVFLDFYLTTFSEYVISEIKKLWGSLFFSKYSKFNLDLKNAAKNSEKGFWYLDNCIWIGIVKLSPLRTGYFSSAANLLKRSSKILRFNKRDFFRLYRRGSDQSIRSRCYDADFNSAWVCFPCCLSKGPLKQHFLDIYLTMFSEFVTSKIQKPCESSFFSKRSKSQLDFKRAAKNQQKYFCF